jgi:hypothetical protein
MKTPREILLNRHAHVTEKLDAIRERVLAAELRHETRNPKPETRNVHALAPRLALTLWRELVWPCRRTWAGLAAIWFVLAAFNLVHSERRQITAVKSTLPPAEMRIVFQEQQQVLAELLGPPPAAAPAEAPRHPNPQPRSERRTVLMIV